MDWRFSRFSNIMSYSVGTSYSSGVYMGYSIDAKCKFFGDRLIDEGIETRLITLTGVFEEKIVI